MVDEQIGVLTVDDQASFRDAMRAVVCATEGFRALGEASSAAEALALADAVHPQLVLMDVRMPGTDGVEATRRLLSHHPDAVVVLVSVDAAELAAAGRGGSGAVAVLRKQDLRPSVLAELWRAHAPASRRSER